MAANARQTAHYASLRATGRVLARMAPLVRIGLVLAGVGLFLDLVGPLVSNVQLTYGERVVTGIVALVVLGGFGLAAWVVGNLLRASAELVDVLVDQAEASQRTADLIEWQLAPTLGRVAIALERATIAAPPATADGGRALAIEGVRRAIEARLWGRAERLLEALTRDFPNAPEAPALAHELATTRRATIDDLMSQLDHARKTGDADRVIALRETLTEHLRGEPLRDLDRQVVGWLMAVIHDRTKGGVISPATPALAARVIDTFGDTPEAERLRVALPELRRKAGLCLRCGQIYRGKGAICPNCQAGGFVPAPNEPGSENRP